MPISSAIVCAPSHVSRQVIFGRFAVFNRRLEKLIALFTTIDHFTVIAGYQVSHYHRRGSLRKLVEACGNLWKLVEACGRAMGALPRARDGRVTYV